MYTRIVTCLCFILGSFAVEASLLKNENFSIIVKENANLGSGVHVHGGAYIGGDLSYTGANGSYGSRLNNGEIGLYVNGKVEASQRLDLMGKNYYSGTRINAPLQNPGEEVEIAVNNDSFFDLIKDKSAGMANLLDTGVDINSRDINRIEFNLIPDQFNVVNLNALNASYLTTQNANLMFSNFTENTFLVINYTLQDTMRFKAKNQNMPSYAYDNIVWNFVGDSSLMIENSVSTFKGTILAVDSDVEWKANDIDGQLVAKSLDWSNTSQSHFYTPWGEWRQYDHLIQGPADVKEPVVFFFIFILLASWYTRQEKIGKSYSSINEELSCLSKA